MVVGQSRRTRSPLGKYLLESSALSGKLVESLSNSLSLSLIKWAFTETTFAWEFASQHERKFYKHSKTFEERKNNRKTSLAVQKPKRERILDYWLGAFERFGTFWEGDPRAGSVGWWAVQGPMFIKSSRLEARALPCQVTERKIACCEDVSRLYRGGKGGKEETWFHGWVEVSTVKGENCLDLCFEALFEKLFPKLSNFKHTLLVHIKHI